MVENLSPETVAATKLYDYAHSGDNAAAGDFFRQEAVKDMMAGSTISGFDAGLTERLKQSGTLPDLLISEWSKLNTDGDMSKLSYSEILAASYSSDPIHKMLGLALNDPRNMEGSINPQTLYPEMSYDHAKELSLNTPEQRPVAEGPAVVAPIYEFPAGVVPPVGEVVPAAGVALPPTGLSAEATAAWSSLQVPGLAPEARLKAITTLVAAGQTSVSIKDADGTVMNVRLEVSPISAGNSKNFVHMFAVDPATGKETVMMRALTDGTNFFKQRDANGEEVGFIGSKWMKNHPASMFKS